MRASLESYPFGLSPSFHGTVWISAVVMRGSEALWLCQPVQTISTAVSLVEFPPVEVRRTPHMVALAG